MAKFRKGDIVLIEAVVDSDFLHEGKQRVMIGYRDIYAVVADLKMSKPTIEIGDMICLNDGSGPLSAEVLSISGEHAWVSFGDGNYATWWLNRVERVDVVDADDLAVAS